jgi:hypothetical protein
MERLTEHHHEEIDRILSREDEILPSSGFVVSVMEAVRREAAAPLPIPFPWKRALPGMVFGGLVLVLVGIGAILAISRLGGMPVAPPAPVPPPSGMQDLFHGGIESAVRWTVLSLLAAFVCVKLSMRLASDRA